MYLFNCSSNPIALLGELDKFVPISPQRVSDISITTNDIKIELKGETGEKVTFTVWYNGTYNEYLCIIGKDSSATISLLRNVCL